MKYTTNIELWYMPDLFRNNKHGQPRANTDLKSALEKAIKEKR